MKKIFNLAVAAFAAVMIISCDKNGEDITVSTVEVSNVDLWANTATLSFGDVTPDAVSYRVKGTETWFDAESVDGVFTIAPVWNESKNDAGLTVYTVEEGTGIFAGKTYEFQVNGETLADADYTSAAGDVIPNGDMSGWSEYENGIYPNAEGNAFWTSGNNSMTPELCVNDNDAAKLSSIYKNAFIMNVFAAGNLFSGSFEYSIPAKANFGAEYVWSARPKALKLKYKSNIGNIDSFNKVPEGSNVAMGDVDKARIFAAVVDWNAMHTVLSAPSLFGDYPQGSWDPETAKSVQNDLGTEEEPNLTEESILGYASAYISETVDDFNELIIPFYWYDNSKKPSAKYTLVISCTASCLGDYFTGCSTNKLWVDDFEWVY